MDNTISIIFFYVIIFLGDKMKRLLFTHIADIDGMGGAILSKLAFDNIDIIYCKNPSDLNNKIIEVYDDNTLYNYRRLCEIDKAKFEECLTVDNKGKRGENLIPYVIVVKGAPVTDSYVALNPRYLRDAIKWCGEYILYWNGMTSYPFYIMSYNGREYDKKAIILPIRLTDNVKAKAKIYQEVQL